MKKTNGNLEILIKLLTYIKPYRMQLIWSGILLLFSTFVSFLQPLMIQEITDKGMVQKDMGRIVTFSVLLAILVVVNQGIDLLQTKIFAAIHAKSRYSVFHQVFVKLLHLRKSYFEDKNNAEILSCLQMDVSQVTSITDRHIVMSVGYIFRIVSGFAGLLMISWQLSFIVLAMIPVKVLLVKTFSAKQEKVMNDYIENSRDFSKWFGDMVNGIEEIKLWGLFLEKDRVFRKKQKKILHLEQRSIMIGGMDSFFESILQWGDTILLYMIGGAMICNGKLSIGAIFAFVSYSGYVTGPISAIINLKMIFAQILPSAKRLFRFLDTETEADTGTDMPLPEFPRIEFANVKFRYETGRMILCGVNFYVNPGEKIAIIGANGSGKTTILDLLLRFYEPQEGSILADGISIDKYHIDEYRSLFSVVSQRPYLFFGDIRSNVDLTGRSGEDQVEKALRASQVSKYISRFPKGTAAQIGQNGVKLSGGERQKIAVARAFVKDSPIVIFDEATSGFDAESSAYLHDMIVNEMNDKSVILITHHDRDLEGMDRIYRIEHGILNEVTNHMDSE